MLSLGSIINIIVNFPSASSQTENFSLGLLLSVNTVISTADRVKVYASTQAMIADGFAADSPEVKAAQLYFGQTPAPSQLAVGVQGAAETAVQALTACRTKNTHWYLCIPVGYAKADLLLIAAYVESATPAAIMFCTTADADVLSGAEGNLCLALKASGYKRTLTQYSATESAAAAIAGYACGENTGDSAFDLCFQAETGVTPDTIDTSAAEILKGENCNFFANYQNTFSFFFNGVMADGTHFDEILGIDMLRADITSGIMQLLTSSPKVALTDDGVAQVTSVIATCCNTALKRGFIAAGNWKGLPVAKLNPGDNLPNGYSIQAGSVDDLSADDRSARKSPPTYVCIILANSLESFTITVNVNR